MDLDASSRCRSQKDMIIASGYSYAGRREVLYEQPAVLECCVAGVPTLRGETVRHSSAAPGRLRILRGAGCLAANVWPRFKIPRQYDFATRCQDRGRQGAPPQLIAEEKNA